MSKKFAALQASHFIEFVANTMPKCPHCGEDYNIRENEAWFLYSEDGPHEVDCDGCHLPFNVSSIASWTFSTDEQEDDE
jgi:hypothetical protein